jgi:hypothetical protein
VTPTGLPYPVDAARPYGRRWGSRRPPGLPAWARQASTPGAAYAPVEAEARTHGLGDTFVRTCRSLAYSESRGTYALPANIFDARPRSARPAGKALITAWGVFNFNRGAWTGIVPAAERAGRRSFLAQGEAGCSTRGGCVQAWDCTPEEEIARPIAKYAELWLELRAAGATELQAARGVRLWHAQPNGLYRPYLRRGRASGFDAAWRSVPANRRRRIDELLEDGGGLNVDVYA